MDFYSRSKEPYNSWKVLEKSRINIVYLNANPPYFGRKNIFRYVILIYYFVHRGAINGILTMCNLPYGNSERLAGVYFFKLCRREHGLNMLNDYYIELPGNFKVMEMSLCV